MSHGFSQLTVTEHPLIQHKMGFTRDEQTSKKEFTELLTEVTLLLGYEATRGLPLRDKKIKTPLTETTVKKLEGEPPIIIPVLRAGLGMVDGMTQLIPTCRVGHLGMYRNEDTLEPVPYYSSYPAELANSEIFVLDPMLATGGSAVAAIDYLKEQGAKSIRMMCILAARPGVERLTEAHPDVKIYAAGFDEELTPAAYITPGLGDAGDRLFDTK